MAQEVLVDDRRVNMDEQRTVTIRISCDNALQQMNSTFACGLSGGYGHDPVV